MRRKSEPLGVKVTRLVTSGFLRGAFYLENVFDNGQFINIVINNPSRVRFRQMQDEVQGQHWIRGEEQNGEFVITEDNPNILYVAVNPTEDKPYGKSMVSSAIFPIVSLLGMMKSVRQVIETQAWPYLMFNIDREKLLNAELDEDELAGEVERVEANIKRVMESAQKGTQVVFGSEVTAEYLGAMARRNLDAVEMMEGVYKRWIVQALQQFPIVAGMDSGNALSTSTDNQLEGWTTFIDSLQKAIEEILTQCFTQVLREQGNAGTPLVELKRNTTFVQKLRLERFNLKVQAVEKMLTMGIITQQQGLDIIRNQDAIDNLSEILPETIAPELLQEPEEDDEPDDVV